MNYKKLEQALNEIQDHYLSEAAVPKKTRTSSKHTLRWFGGIAAAMALVLLLHFIQIPMPIQAKAVSLSAEPRIQARPSYEDYTDRDAFRADSEAWMAARETRHTTATAALQQSKEFFSQSLQHFLTGSQENLLYSPINAYIGLAAVAQLTAGDTRQQLLDVLHAPSPSALCTQVSALWESVYQNDGNEICTLATSLWLDEGIRYNQNVMDTLAYHYYASIYQQELNSPQATKDIGAWLNNNTGGFLKNYTDNLQLPEEAVLALYSTIYFQGKWTDEFVAAHNTTDVFHSTAGDTKCTYMNAQERQMHYYWGDSYGAVNLPLKGNRSMWFILPDEGKTVDDVLADSQYWDMLLAVYDEWENKKYMKVNLSVPKFDISAKRSLRSGFEQMGITHLFDPLYADFSASLAEPAYITTANQAIRVAIDEQGVTAAAYLELPAAGAAMPPEEIIDFVLDRPFLFIITGSGIPLFAGVVNQP